MGFGSTDFDIDVYLCETGYKAYMNILHRLEIFWIVFMFYYFCVKPCNSIEQIQLNLTVYEILSISHSLLINHTIEVFFKYFIIHINISLSQRSSSELKHLVSRVIKRILSK